LGLASGAGRRSKQSRKTLARTGAVLLAVAAAQSLLIGALDLTGSPIRTPLTAGETVPYYLTTVARTPRSAPTAQAAGRRPPKARRRETSPAPGPLPRPGPSLLPPAAAGPPAPDHGRWTVGPGAWPEAGHGRIVMSVCAPANLANLSADAREACVEALKTQAAEPPARRGAARDWKDHGPLSACSEPKNEPAHKLLLDRCRGLGLGLKYLF